MNAEILEQAGIDYQRGVKRFVGRANLFDKALTKFLKDSTYSRICASYEAGDREALFANAHEFKGMCGNIALDSLYEKGDALVSLLRGDGGSQEEIDQAFQMLKVEYEAIYQAIQTAAEATL